MQNDPDSETNGLEPDHRLESTQHGGEEGYYDPLTDIHLYDLMGFLSPDPDAPVSLSSSDALVAAAAWSVDPAEIGSITRWLARLKQQPGGWLTPWRVGEPLIMADLSLDSPPENARGERSYVIARLNNEYQLGAPLLDSLTQAIDRFQDLRKAIEPEMTQELKTAPRRATRLWLSSLDETAEVDRLDEG
ncbi:MAG TPA: hypothetical protein VFJ58_25505 [Armatimonadota bacterium]|nr:hypothetical protein [Armatimonadota bacterium]